MTIHDTSAQEPTGDGRASGLHVDGEDLAEVKDTLTRSARGLSTELKRESRRLVDDATESATAIAKEKKVVAADYLRALAEAAGASCEVLDERGYAGSSRFLTRAVEGLESFSGDLATREPGELLDDALRYARRNPALFLGAALFAGFGISRLVQASAAADTALEDEGMEYDSDDEMNDEMNDDEMNGGMDDDHDADTLSEDLADET
jgi:hypothetical protein